MAERQLVPVEAIEQANLSSRQQQDLIQAARMYLRDQHIVITPATFQQAMGVLGDATARQLRVEGRALDPKDRIRQLIASGLELRESVSQQATEVIDHTLKNPTTHAQLAGSFALPSVLVETARREIGNFPLTGDLKASQQIADIIPQRKAALARFARIGLSSLPEQLGEVTIDRFPTAAERSKLTKNMIASFVFRGTVSPLISTADLKDFVESNYGSLDNFSQEKQQSLIQVLGITEDTEKSYISDLFEQTKAAFSLYQRSPQEDDPQLIDKFYHLFSRDLLLLHPALEESQLVTLPNLVQDGVSSIWDRAIDIRGVKIASPDLLVQAARQAQAHNDQPTADRLREGLAHWRWLATASERHQRKINQATAELQRKEDLLEQVTDPSLALPPEANFIRYEVQRRALDATRSRARESENLATIIAENAQMQEDAKAYEQWLQAEAGSDTPTVPMPRRVYVEKLRSEEREKYFSEMSMRRILTITEDLLTGDYFFKEELPFGTLTSDRGVSWIQELIAKTQEEITQVDLDSGDESFNPGIITELRRHIIFQFEPNSKHRIRVSADLRNFDKFWLGSLGTISDLGRSGGVYAKQLWADFKLRALRERLGLLKYSLSIMDERAIADTEREQARKKYIDFTADPNTPLPQEAQWTTYEAKAYLQEVKAYDLPDLSGLDLAQLGRTAREMKTMFLKFPAGLLPMRITSVEDAKRWIQTRKSQLHTELEHAEQQVPENTKKRRAKGRRIDSLNRRIDIADKLIVYSDHQLFPLSDVVGLDRDTLLRTWRKRVNLAIATIFKDEIAKQTEEAQEEYEGITRIILTDDLTAEIASRRKTLEYLRQRDIHQEFIDNMRSVNLVLDQ